MSGFEPGLPATAALAACALLVGACASEGYVNDRVGAVKSQVDALNARNDESAAQIQALSGALQDADRGAQEASARVGARRAQHGFARQVLGADASTSFAAASWALTPADRTSLAAFAQKLEADDQDVYVEIQGHGDARGSAAYNQALGLKRAEATRRFLAGQGVPLHRMSVISFGEDEPIASNDTAQGQVLNRRATLVVVMN